MKKQFILMNNSSRKQNSNKVKISFFVLFIIPFFALSQTSNQNWVKTKNYKIPTTTSIPTPTINEANVQVNYSDGLGRVIQQVAHQQSNSGNDIITHLEYDINGRSEKEFLPYSNQNASLNYNSSANSDVLSFYNTPTYENTTNPYYQKQFESSQLNKVFKQSAPGNSWLMGSGHETKFDYEANISNEVKHYVASTIWNTTNQLYDITFSDLGDYSPNQLYKFIIKDENWISGKDNTTEEFKNNEGQIVLRRKFDGGVPHDTYYIYDVFNNLTYVIPPAVNGSVTQTVLDDMCYQYKYDGRNRLVEKKLPGKQWDYIVYDKLDRVVAIGPKNSPFSGDTNIGWLITKYDIFNRPVYTGWYSGHYPYPQGRKDMQDLQNSQSIINEYNGSATINSVATAYTNNTFPTSGFYLLTINYYDNYNYPNAPVLPANVETQTLATNFKGLLTGSWIRVLTTGGEFLGELSYIIYDSKNRPVRGFTKNYLGGYTQVDTKLDWSGKAEYTLTKHKRLASSSEIITKNIFEYSAQNRLVKHLHQIGTGSGLEQLLAFNTYDELGKLTSKKVGGTDITGATSFQKIDFSYNIRGWLRGINNVANLTPTASENDLFAFKINYNVLEDGSQSTLFNGNISQTLWRTNSDNVKRQYTYQYDKLNRLLEANYSKPGSASTLDNFLEKLSYDKNGNIQFIERNGDMDSDGLNTVNQIDKLDYTYDTNNKNLLLKVIDKSLSPQGFNETNDVVNGDSDGITDNTNDYLYDLNGNMISDTNKGISSIIYNYLNLPIKITFGSAGTIEYIYNAVGQKVLKKVTENGVVTTTDYLSGYQYKNTELQFFPHAEGYVKFTAGGKGGGGTYSYIFNYTDHLGNIRLSYAKDFSTGTLKIIEENHYYAFGLKHTNYNSDLLAVMREGNGDNTRIAPPPPQLPPTYKYKYNSKEFQNELGLNMYDYGARNYDPALGRWMNIDPLAETSRRFTPYAYALNNPVYFIDPDGMEAEEFENEWHKDKDGNLVPDKGDTKVEREEESTAHFSFDGEKWNKDHVEIDEVTVTNEGIGFSNKDSGEDWFDDIFVGENLSEKEVRTQALEPNFGKIAEVTGNSLTVLEKVRDSKIGDLIRGNGAKAVGIADGVAVTGKVLGGIGLANTGAQFLTGKISGAEAIVDGIFGVVGFFGPVGAGISLTYSLAKTGYELYTGKTLFDKPTQ